MTNAMKRAGLAVAVLLVGSVGRAEAGLIVGPAMIADVVGHGNSGIEFTALTDSTLDGFVFWNQGGADLIQLQLSDHTVLHSLSTPAGDPSYSVTGLGWALTAGTDYYLLATASSPPNGRYGESTFPVSDADLRVNYGAFGYSADHAGWGDFAGLATSHADVTATPEPSTIAMVATALPVGLVWWARGRRRVA